MKHKKLSFRHILGLVVLFGSILFLLAAIKEITYVNKANSKSRGTVGNGSLQNGYLIPFSGNNYKYFSPLSYYIMNNGYVHNRVYQTVLDAYKICEETCPETKFMVMECSDRNGGKMLLHRTHQNGTSIDFAVPMIHHNKPYNWLNYTGVWHYLLGFDDEGKLAFMTNVEIDFETLAKHILALDEAGKKHGVGIKKVILKIELKDDFYATPSGKKVKAKGIYFARSLPKLINNAHEEHYHIDFMIR